MPVGGNPIIDSSRTLTAINNSAADVRTEFDDGANWTAEILEGKGVVLERSNEGAELEFLFDVGVDIICSEVGRGKVSDGVAGFGWRKERYVPTVGKTSQQFRTIEVGLEGGLPGR